MSDENKKTTGKPKHNGGIGHCGNLPGRGPGRPKGSKNSVNMQVMNDVFRTYQELGGVKYLKSLAESDPKLYTTMLTRLIPTHLQQDISGTLTIDNLVNAWGTGADGDDSDDSG